MAKSLVIKRNGFGQVEPNHMSFQSTNQIYAQLPAAKTIKQLENGQFVKYDIASGEVNLTGKGEWVMVYNEEKLYGDFQKSHKEYAMLAKDAQDEIIVPRCVGTNVGDIYTTNCLFEAGALNSTVAGKELTEGTTILTPNEDGFLDVATDSAAVQWLVVKCYTMPDGQPGVKLQRIK